MVFKFNKESLKDKILACWIGKNIGGTVGGPFEGTTDMQDIQGYTTPKGEPLPNDDLDLQIAWLMTLDRAGARGLDANELAHSWMMFITPHWNEYGVAHKNLKMGLLPPLSGEYDNKLWRNSNGAWIRTEIWACLAPGFPNVAVKYAIMDASVDHGIGEGTYAAVFTAAMESIAFVENDIRSIIETALSFIPDESQTARSVKLVLDEYDKKTPYHETRCKIVELNSDLGWFQAPGNVAFAVLGLIYGEGDFKKSIIYTVNCGDDTDCTAGTVGAVLGIVGGTDGIPQDWQEYIGDRIIQICLNPQYLNYIPKTCTEFTDRVMAYMPEILRVNKVKAEYTDSDTEYDKEEAFSALEGYAEQYFKRGRFSFDITRPAYVTARVEFDNEPVAVPGEELSFTIKFQQLFIYGEPIEGYVNITLPEGWSAKYRKTVHIAKPRDIMAVSMPYQDYDITSDLDVTLIPGEIIAPLNKLYVNVELNTSPMPFIIPVVIIG
ncbi:MAG: ADP-ribosylglycohydrolase family protein [Clostridia bacterium]|nr:ADP-ribosylglycohydrolase family protein [Clostridia bacterium]